MRILFALHTWYPEGHGGTEVHARAVGDALSAKGHQLGVFARTGRPGRPEYEVTTEWQGKTSVTRINNTYQETPGFEWTYKNRRIHEAFERELDEFKPDIVHVHHLVGLSSTILEGIKLRNLPIVMTLHDFWTVCPRGQRMRRDLTLCETVDRETCFHCLGALWPHLFQNREAERTIVDIRGQLSPSPLAEWDRHMAYALRLCDLLICPSEFHRERMLDFPLDPERVLALPHGLDSTPFEQQPKRPLSSVKRIGFIGSVIPVKGVHVLIEAFQKLGRPELVLDIHGEIPPFHDDRTYGERLRALSGPADNVRFHGPYTIEMLPKLLDSIDILVVPSLWWETFCLTIREAQLAGVPVIASDHGALREALDGETDGLLFRPGDADDLRAKLERLLADETLRSHLGNRRASVQSLGSYVAELEKIYARAVEIASMRRASLVVAPPSFPESPADLAPVSAPLPWERLSLAFRQDGGVAVAVETRMPSRDVPNLGLGLALREGSRHLGNVNVEIDLSALEEAHRQVAAAAGLVAARSEGEAKGTDPEGALPPSAPENEPVAQEQIGVRSLPRAVKVKAQKALDPSSEPAGFRLVERSSSHVEGSPERVLRRDVVSEKIKTRRWTPHRPSALEVVEVGRPRPQ